MGLLLQANAVLGPIGLSLDKLLLLRLIGRIGKNLSSAKEMREI